MNYLLNRCSNYPKEFTYLGIGSAPHDPPDKIDAVWDQVLPVFILDLLHNTTKTLRIIHFDPQFKLDAMKTYFDLKHLGLSLKEEKESYWVWSNERIEIVISPDYFDHTPSTDIFLKDLTESILKTNAQLVVQEFTGRELNETRTNVYKQISEKSLFKKKILFDITYGEACHCMTDMTKYKPIYDTYGDFFNFTLYTAIELKKVIGMSERTDKLILSYFYKEYIEILDGLHLMYRRNIKKAENATDEDPDALMALLQTKLRALFPIFRALKVLPSEKEAALEHIFETYRENDMYKWYTAVSNHLRPPVH